MNVIPLRDLHFSGNQRPEATALVQKYHYSHRMIVGAVFIGGFHLSGGLFGDFGEMIAAIVFSIPPARWQESVVELSRMVRHPKYKVPLTALISRSMPHVKKHGDLLVSCADQTEDHLGFVYQAASWYYHGKRQSRIDQLRINGKNYPDVR